MANRIPIPHLHLPRPTINLDWQEIRSSPRRAAAWRPPRGLDLRAFLFQIATAPFWLSSEIPAPTLPGRDQPLPPGGLAGDHVGRLLGQLALRIWFQRMLSILFRVAWLPLLVGCGWLALELRDGPDFNPRALLWIEAILLVPAVVFAALVRPTRREVARMLDRSFDLQDRMITAVENIGVSVPAQGERALVPYLQMADAANVVTELKSHPVFRLRPPVREFVLAVACALLLAALFFMRGVGGGIPTLTENAVPLYTSAAERLAAQRQPDPEPPAVATDAPTREEVQAQAERSAQTQQDLKHLSDALADQAVTRSAADAIRREEYSEAADLIRTAAESADQMSEAARNGLADDLDNAADEMSDGSSSLAEAARNAADGLREGGEAAKEGMRDLGDAVDQAATDIVSQDQLRESMRQATAAEASGRSGKQSNEGGDPSEGPGSASDPADDDSSSQDSRSDPGQPGGSSAQAAEPQDDDSGNAEGDEQPGSTGDTSGEDTGGATKEGNAQAAGGKTEQPAGDAMPGNGSTPGDTTSGQSTGDQSDDGSEGLAGNPGSGAGGSDDNRDTGSSSTGESTTGNTGDGEAASDPELTDAPGANGEGDGAKTDSASAVTLSRSQDGGGVRTSSNGGAATSGGGGGATLGKGATSQGDVGEAGPDSNRVPAEYRGIVEDYFSDLDGS